MQFGIEVRIQFKEAQTRQWYKRYKMWLRDLNVEHISLKKVIEN